MTNVHHIATIPGDGVGTEVLPEATRVIDFLGGVFDFRCEWIDYPWGCEYYVRTGRMMAGDALERLRPSDAIFLGAVGRPDIADHISLWGLLIPIRRTFRQFANVRPIKAFLGIPSPLRHDLVRGVDLVIVRENNEGEYSEVGGRLYKGTHDEVAVQESIFTRRGVERVVAYAYELARERRGTLISATKSNGIVHTMPFWDEIVEEIAQLNPEIETSKMHIDALAAQLILRPAEFDVIVASNLLGDILSDLTAAIVGSIGIAPSANVDPSRTYPSMFEPIHGAAPDIAGRNVANPIGQIWSGAMMLRHLGEHAAADDLELGLSAVLDEGHVRSRDLGGTASTQEVTDAVIERLGRGVDSRNSSRSGRDPSSSDPAFSEEPATVGEVD
jgi:tartrate dehydrogenase/decarboxylase / D-malate dehydrogenase